MKQKTLRDRVITTYWNGRARLAHWCESLAERLQPVADMRANQESTPQFDDPMADVLLRALGNRTGKLRVSDAFLICGMEAGRVNQEQIERFGRAISALGWQRARSRSARTGLLEYAYVKGNAAERQAELVVEYDPHLRSVRIEVDKNERTPTTN